MPDDIEKLRRKLKEGKDTHDRAPKKPGDEVEKEIKDFHKMAKGESERINEEKRKVMEEEKRLKEKAMNEAGKDQQR